MREIYEILPLANWVVLIINGLLIGWMFPVACGLFTKGNVQWTVVLIVSGIFTMMVALGAPAWWGGFFTFFLVAMFLADLRRMSDERRYRRQ